MQFIVLSLGLSLLLVSFHFLLLNWYVLRTSAEVTTYDPILKRADLIAKEGCSKKNSLFQSSSIH